MKKWLKIAGVVVICFFALVGFVFSAVFIGMQFDLFNVRGSSSERNASIVATSSSHEAALPPQPCDDPQQKVCDWAETLEWQVIAGGLTKDKNLIDAVSYETGVPSRLIAAVVVPEQMRFFTSEREVFKRVFEPLKILGSMSQFSLGVSGIKQDTANEIEQNAQDPQSPYYVAGLSSLMAYGSSTTPHDAALFYRLTDEHNHYFSYLYTAIYIREVEQQWKAAGTDISNNPAVVATLFNIGFKNSVPNPTPSAGGAAIIAGGETYTYGELAGAFYKSSELLDGFPR